MFKAVINLTVFVLGLEKGRTDMKKMVSMGERGPQGTGLQLCVSLPWGRSRHVSWRARWISSSPSVQFFASSVPTLNTCYCRVCNMHLITENQQSARPGMYYSHFTDKETRLMLYTLQMTKLGINQPRGCPVSKLGLLSITQPCRYVCSHWEHWCPYTATLCPCRYLAHQAAYE